MKFSIKKVGLQRVKKLVELRGHRRSIDEKQDDYGLTPKEYVIDLKLLNEKAKSDAIVLHSLPRMDELNTDVDNSKYARYWEEAFNGVVMRMSLLSLVLGAME